MRKRLRAAVLATALAGGIVAATFPAQAGVCVDAYVELNGDVLVNQAECLG